MLWRKRSKKAARPLCGAVVAAAGSSTRMGGDKILMELDGEPVIIHTLRALEEAEEISQVVVVTREELIVTIAGLCRQWGLDKVSKVVAGGADRTRSVRLGTLELTGDPELIAVHDGARPLATPELIGRVVRAAQTYGSAVPAVPIADTVRQVDGRGLSTGTVDRAALRAVQTPQVFQEGLLRAALHKAVEDGETLTDDCAAVERLGMRVALVEGEAENIKLTTPVDLLVARAILEERRGAL